MKLKDIEFIVAIPRKVKTTEHRLKYFGNRKEADDYAASYSDIGIHTVVFECKIVSVHNPTKKAVQRRKERLRSK